MDTDTIIRQLEYEADKHKNDRLFTGQTNITALCRDLIPKMKELERYEDLEQDGRLLELPCKVGDIVHFIDDIDGVYERSAVVTGIEIDTDGIHIIILMMKLVQSVLIMSQKNLEKQSFLPKKPPKLH